MSQDKLNQLLALFVLVFIFGLLAVDLGPRPVVAENVPAAGVFADDSIANRGLSGSGTGTASTDQIAKAINRSSVAVASQDDQFEAGVELNTEIIDTINGELDLGLSLPTPEIPEIKLPVEIPTVPELPRELPIETPSLPQAEQPSLALPKLTIKLNLPTLLK